MRFVLSLIIVASLATGAGSAAPPGALPVADNEVFVLTGGGWGHNVGLSQWGAYGQASAGRDYQEILAQYFHGTKLAPSPLTKLRVLVSPNAHKVSISSSVSFRVKDATGKTYDVLDADAVLTPSLRLDVIDPAAAEGVPAGASPTRLVPPLQFVPARGAVLNLDGKDYRGQLQVTPVKGALQVIDIVGLEAFVQGVVPGEMPKEWPLEALKAQAVAARTYAVANVVSGNAWDVESDSATFAYYGVQSEAAATTRAVRETKGQVLTYAGKPITAFYFSSSGGRTLSSQDVFGVSLPYLKGAPDPWDEVSPNHRWPARTFSPASLASALQLVAPVSDVAVVPSAPGRALALLVTTSDGAATQVGLEDVRVRLALKSPNFKLGVLRLDPPPSAAPAGTKVSLTGVARNVGPAMLEQRQATGVWTAAGKLVLRRDGSFTTVVRPSATTVYRISAAGLIGPATAVSVVSPAAR